jgi:hypothetical protein
VLEYFNSAEEQKEKEIVFTESSEVFPLMIKKYISKHYQEKDMFLKQDSASISTPCV